VTLRNFSQHIECRVLIESVLILKGAIARRTVGATAWARRKKLLVCVNRRQQVSWQPGPLAARGSASKTVVDRLLINHDTYLAELYPMRTMSICGSHHSQDASGGGSFRLRR